MITQTVENIFDFFVVFYEILFTLVANDILEFLIHNIFTTIDELIFLWNCDPFLKSHKFIILFKLKKIVSIDNFTL